MATEWQEAPPPEEPLNDGWDRSEWAPQRGGERGDLGYAGDPYQPPPYPQAPVDRRQHTQASFGQERGGPHEGFPEPIWPTGDGEGAGQQPPRYEGRISGGSAFWVSPVSSRRTEQSHGQSESFDDERGIDLAQPEAPYMGSLLRTEDGPQDHVSQRPGSAHEGCDHSVWTLPEEESQGVPPGEDVIDTPARGD